MALSAVIGILLTACVRKIKKLNQIKTPIILSELGLWIFLSA